MNLFQKTINIGISQKLLPIEIRLLKLTNLINLIYIFFISIPMVIAIHVLDTTGFQNYIRFILLIPCSILNISLNYFHRFLPAKILTIFAPFIAIFVFPIINQFIHAGFFLWFPYGIIIIGAISFFVFSYEKEKNILHFTLLFFALAAIFYDKVLFYSVQHTLDLSFIYGSNYIYYQVSKIALLGFLYGVLYIAKVTTYKYRKELSSLNLILDQKNNELNCLNQNLETIVKKRTAQLDLQNKRIKELTYSNSHKVRAHVARIIGLVTLTKENKLEEEEQKFCYTQIQKQAFDLDEETKEISRKLSEEY
jgi:hypothetical protein